MRGHGGRPQVLHKLLEMPEKQATRIILGNCTCHLRPQICCQVSFVGLSNWALDAAPPGTIGAGQGVPDGSTKQARQSQLGVE